MRLTDGTTRKTRRSINDPGHAHELTFSCYKAQPLLSRDRTRTWFVEALDQSRRRWSLELWAYVIMPEHVHLLLLPCAEDYRISSILQAIKQPVARRALAFLRKNGPSWLENLKGAGAGGDPQYHFWQAGGGYDRNITSAAIAWKAVDCIHANPVRRGLVADPRDWRWSSAGWYAGDDDVVLEMDATPPSG